MNTAKHFVLQLGSLISLYLSLAFLLVLTFGFISMRFPDPLDSVWQIESAASSIRLGFAMVIVFFPTYLALTRVVNKNRRSSSDTSYLGLTKWLIYLSLLVAGLTLLGDLVAVIMGFLEGELTTRFILKALAVFVVIGAAFYYYLKDAQGYWLKNEKTSVAYGAGAVVLVAAMLIASLSYIETPSEVREGKADQQQVQDLRELQWAIEDRLRVEGELPQSLDTLFSGRPLPAVPQGRPAYQYNLTEDGFELCATFASDSKDTDSFARPFPVMGDQATPHITNPDDWYYEAGEWCFKRIVAS